MHRVVLDEEDTKFLDEEFKWKLVEIARIARDILLYLPRKIGDYVDHGIDHSKRIIGIINELYDVVNEYCSYKLDVIDVFLLKASAYLHDTGNIIRSREVHGETSASIIEKIVQEKFKILTSNETKALMMISWAHQGSLLRLISLENKFLKIRDKNVNIGFLSALFRLADALDVGVNRASPIVYEVIKEELNEVSRRHWEDHMAILRRALDPEEGTILLFASPEKIESAKRLADRITKELRECNIILREYGFPLKEVEVKRIPDEYVVYRRSISQL